MTPEQLKEENARLFQRNQDLGARNKVLQSYAEWMLWSVQWIAKRAETDPEAANRALAKLLEIAEEDFAADALRHVPEEIQRAWGDRRRFSYFDQA